VLASLASSKCQPCAEFTRPEASAVEARADHLNVGVASGEVWKDTGAKVMHLAPNTTSNILANRSPLDGGVMGYRGLVRMGHNSQGSKARVQCDGLMMDPESRSDTWPDWRDPLSSVRCL